MKQSKTMHPTELAQYAKTIALRKSAAFKKEALKREINTLVSIRAQKAFYERRFAEIQQS